MMIILALALATPATVAAVPHNPDWKKVAWSVEKQAEMDVDQASLDRTNPSSPTIMQRQRDKHGSTVVLVQYNCAARTWSPISMHGRRARLVDASGHDVVMPVAKRSMAEAAFEYACKTPRSIDGPDFRGDAIEYRGDVNLPKH